MQKRLLELDKSKDKSIGTWSTDDIAKYVREVNPRLVEALISPEDPLSKDEYQSRIEHEIAKTLYKKNITHHTAPEKAESVYYALRHVQEAKDLRKQGKTEEADKRELAAKQRWEASHAVTSATEKPFQYVGKGVFGSVEAVVPGEAGPIVMKKSLLPGASEPDKDNFIEETRRLESLNHPGIIRLVPVQKSKQFFEASLVKQPESDPVEQTSDRSILSDDPQLDQLISDKSALFTSQPENTAYLEAGGVPWTVLIKGKKDNNVEIEGIITDTEELEGIDDETLLQEIKGATTNISLNIYNVEELEYILTDINSIWTNRNFSPETVNDLLSHIGESLASNSANEASLKCLNTLKALFATPKTEPIHQPAGGPLPMKNIQNMARQLCDALDYLHKKNIVHLDITSNSVLIQPDGTVKVIDFGVSRPIDEYKDNPDISGSPTYMAPEVINQLYKNAEYPQVCSEAVDVFSAGCLLHQLATGQYYCDVPTGNNFHERLFKLMDQTVNQTDTLQQKMQERIDKRYSDNPEKAAQLKDLLAKMLEPQPEKRISMQDALKHHFFQ